MVGFLIPLLIGLVLNIVSYLLMPKPKQPKPDEVKDLENPTAEAGRPVPVIFGTLRIKALNVIWFGEKSTVMREVEDSGGKK